MSGWVFIDSTCQGVRMDAIRIDDFVWDCKTNGMHVRSNITENVMWWQQQVREQAARRMA